eukprot:gene40745-50412_t
MRAIAISRPGGPEVLQVIERPLPQAGAGECLIAVEAYGVNRPDVLQRKGAYPPPPGASDLPGLEVAGRIVAGDAGELAVAGFKLGDMLFIERIAPAMALGNTGLADAWNKAFAEVLADGSYAAVSKKYFNEDLAPAPAAPRVHRGYRPSAHPLFLLAHSPPLAPWMPQPLRLDRFRTETDRSFHSCLLPFGRKPGRASSAAMPPWSPPPTGSTVPVM